MKAVFFSSKTAPRLQYIVTVLLGALGFDEIVFTQNKEDYLAAEGVKFNYSTACVSDDELWIEPVSLLFESTIKKQDIDIFKWQELSCFFRVNNGPLPFDIFAASFYLLSRYEEYLPHQKDMYGRYAHENSLAFQQGFLNVPLVNMWLKEFKLIMLKKFPLVQLQEPAFKFVPTYDIDIAWSYLHKGLFRNAGGFWRDILSGSWHNARKRVAVLFAKRDDPFDSYAWLHQQHLERGLQPVYFFLLSQKNSIYDKNTLPRKNALQELIKEHVAKYETGIHPSWQSGDSNKVMENEIHLLSKISGKTITKSRQHYIRMNLPDTYRKLLTAGITADYSMGYGSINGFRASYCLPYKWYDLHAENITDLTVHPFCYMDANALFEQHLNAQQALAEALYYLQIVKQVNGQFITIWHNHFLGSDRLFSGWRRVYETLLNEANK